MDRIVLVAFDGVQTLDLIGPADVFAAATTDPLPGAYEVVVASSAGRPVSTTAGCAIGTQPLRGVKLRRTDTVLVAGGGEAAIRAAVADEAVRAFLGRAGRTARRVGSVCSGAFVLAAAGLLDGLRAATHWSACARLAAYFPAVTVDRDAIFVQEGRVWTSAGVTTGIDMALAMVEEDHGRALADSVAARLVLYVRRPGFQSQFSDALVAQAASDPLAPAIAWARDHLRQVTPETLARRAGMSPRTFHRRCAAELETTPAKLIEKLRVEQARLLLSTAAWSTEPLAQRCGFGTAAMMNRAFRRELGVLPREYRLLFGSSRAR
ncbi:MAG: helix-turn-helix protein [Labilithrix sp.]|nr:helix-turn-helix protein [Labilithrix sp.]